MTLDQRNNSNLLWIIIGVILCLILGYAAYYFMTADAELIANEPATSEVKQAAPEAKAPASSAASEAEMPASIATTPLITEDVLKEAVPENESLAKEEIAKLQDLQTQLQDQETLLKAQHADADELIRLKEEQIKLLEKQLATQE